MPKRTHPAEFALITSNRDALPREVLLSHAALLVALGLPPEARGQLVLPGAPSNEHGLTDPPASSTVRAEAAGKRRLRKERHA